MTGRKRLGALILCIGLILVLSVSVVFIAHEADHDCSGEDCPVCRMVAVNIRLMRTLGLAALVLLLFRVLLSGQSARRRPDAYVRVLPGTLVSWKIRLDD